MQNVSLLNDLGICGFYELNAAGAVLYSRPKRDGKFVQPDRSLIGLDFFTDVFLCRNATDLRRRFLDFTGGKHSTETFMFGGQFSDVIVPLRVMFVCLTERNDGKREVRYYVDLKQS